MKKVLGTGLLAVCALACVQQEASAWINERFSIGLTWEKQSAHNSFGWGLWRNGQVPGPAALQSGPFGPPPPYLSPYGYGGMPYGYGYGYGGMPYGHGGGTHGGHAAMPMSYDGLAYDSFDMPFAPSYAQPYYGMPQYATNPGSMYYPYGR